MPQKKPAPDARVLKRRDYEDKLYSMQQGVQVRLVSCTCTIVATHEEAFRRASHAVLQNERHVGNI